MRFYSAALYHAEGVLPTRTQLIYLKDGRVLTYDPIPQDVDGLGMKLTRSGPRSDPMSMRAASLRLRKVHCAIGAISRASVRRLATRPPRWIRRRG